jgi:hypothetical protein
VRRLRGRLSISDGPNDVYFGANVRKALADAQKARNAPLDGIYSPALDQQWGWSVFTGSAQPVS